MAKLLYLFLPLLFLLRPSSGEIKNLKITSDSRPMILFERFGFTETGHTTISVSSSKMPRLDIIEPNWLGFFLLSEDSLIQVITELQSNPNLCVLDSKHTTQLFTFRDLSPPPNSSHNYTYLITSPNEYSLFFANCAAEYAVTMDVRIELYNLDDLGRQDYLSAGLTLLPAMYFWFFALYSAFSGYWIYLCLQSKKSVQKIHLLMGLLVIIKALNLLCAAVYKHFVKVTGEPQGWDVFFYILQLMRGVLWFTVIILIGSGWSFLKPFLQGREKVVLMMVIPLQVLANVASIVIGVTGPFTKDWVTWHQVYLLVDIICCCVIIVWLIMSLREVSKTGVKAARNVSRLTLFWKFYIVVIGYLIFTRIVLFAVRTMVVYKYQWVASAAEEIVVLAFYVIMFYLFRPDEKNECLFLDDEETEGAELSLRCQEFEPAS